MKKSEMYRRVIAIIVRECSVGDEFETLEMLFEEYRVAKYAERLEEGRRKDFENV